MPFSSPTKASVRALSCPRASYHPLIRSHSRSIATAAATVQPPAEPIDHGPNPPPPPQPRHTPSPQPRLDALRVQSPRPFSSFLTDRFGRQHTYLRISLTERCNLRCTYCMPAAGVPLSPARTQLTTPEILLLARAFVAQGVDKIRLTGGEPTVRKDFVPLVQELGRLRQPQGESAGPGLRELCITSNGVALGAKVERLLDAGLTGVNLSLDTLDPATFARVTRRPAATLGKVRATLERLVGAQRAGARLALKLNVVVMRGVNEREMCDFVELGRERDVEVRFIEYMPFDGNRWARETMVGYEEMLGRVRERWPALAKMAGERSETSKTWKVPGFEGRVGFITSMTENFCAGCNRLRITSDGSLKVCLFGDAEVSLRDLLRKGNGGEPIEGEAWEAMKRAEMDSREGRTAWIGSPEGQTELLEVIGKAVGRKKARHAGLGQLENMPNRPMILIDDLPKLPPAGFSRNQPASLVNSLALMPHRRTKVPVHLLPISTTGYTPLPLRKYSTAPIRRSRESSPAAGYTEPPATTPNDVPQLPHLTATSEVHMVPIGSKTPTARRATAVGHVAFSKPATLDQVRAHALRKGDVLAVARIAGVMATKRTPDLVPLCHPSVVIEGVTVRIEPVGPEDSKSAPKENAQDLSKATGRDRVDEEQKRFERRLAKELKKPYGRHGGVRLVVTVDCFGKTGVEMEALTGVVGAALAVVDMCKSVDRGIVAGGMKVVRKEGGRSGLWVLEGWE